MPGTLVTAERTLFYLEDVAAGAANSEANANKIASNSNFILERITKPLHFGVGGGNYSGLSGYPYTFSNNSEICAENLLIQKIVITNKTSGISGSTVFYLEKRPYLSGTWSTMFSTNCTIDNTAADNLVFNSTDVSAPSGVTLPVLASGMSNLNFGDEIRCVLVSAADQANNLLITLECSPI
jgi:hypothetical protein